MLARGLLELRPTAGPGGTRAYFTEAGYAALHLLAQDRRSLDPKQYAHVRQELGLEPDPAGDSQDEG
jgi:putative component of toxin-antitoxin plasmid stabilization module